MRYQAIFIPLFLFLVVQRTFSQDSLQNVIQIGGLNRYAEIPHQKLENATLRVLYLFTQKVKSSDKTILKCDTMALVVGNNFSVYYDWNRETKYKKMMNPLAHLGGKIENISYYSPVEFLEIATDEKLLTNFTLNRESSEILKDRKREIVVTTDLDDANIVKETFYLLEENIPPQQWQLQEGRKNVLGYVCQKATCSFKGRNYTAWFTLNIPVNDGPYKFYGLPGLILMLEDANQQFQFAAIGLENLSNVEIVSDNKDGFIKCTPEQYKIIKKRMLETQYLYYPNVKRKTLYYTRKRFPVTFDFIEKE